MGRKVAKHISLVPENYTPGHEPASAEEIDAHRSYTPEEASAFTVSPAPFPAHLYDLSDENRVTDMTLQKENKTARGGSGASGRSRPAEKPRLTPLQRIDRFVTSVNFSDPTAFSPETDEDRAVRHQKLAYKKLDQQAKRGRPRQDAELRVHATTRVKPSTAAAFKMFGANMGQVLDRIAENIIAELESEEELTGQPQPDTLAA